MKIKISKNGKKKLIIKGDEQIERVMRLIELDSDPIIVDENTLFGGTFDCPRCGEVLCINDDYCSCCGRPIKVVD